MNPASPEWTRAAPPRQNDFADAQSASASLGGFLDTLDLPIVVLARDRTIVYFNQAATQVLGVNSLDVGHLPSNTRLLGDFRNLDELAAEVMAHGAPLQREIQSGDRWFLVRITPCEGSSCPIGSVALTFTNVTAFRASIAQAIYEREYTKTILNSVAQPLVVLDATLSVQTGNRAFYTMFEVSREAAQGRPLSHLGNHHWGALDLWDSLKLSLAENRPFTTAEVEANFPALGSRTLLFDASPILRDGAPMVLVSLRDITERKKAEAALRQSEQRYRTLFNSMDEGFCIIEMIFDENQKPLDYRFLEINPAFAHQSGLSDAKGKRARGLAPGLEQRWLDIYGRIALTGEPARFVDYTSALNRWYEVYAFRVEPAAALQVGVVFNNITERKRQEEDLERTVAERTAALRETVGELEAFSYSIAHDMRAPLRAMQGFARILSEEHAAQLDPQARDYLRRITASARRLDRLIQDVLNYSKIIKAEVVIEALDADRLIRDIIEAYPNWQPPAAEIQIQGVLPKVLGNEAFLTQCVSNIVNNAVKFVSRGTLPRVRIWAEEIPAPPADAAPQRPHGSILDDQHYPPRVRLYFQDNGIGIPPDKHIAIFHMFERIHPAAEYEGTGIGLTIVRRAAERMGGSVGLQSQLGQGSRFWIELDKA